MICHPKFPDLNFPAQILQPKFLRSDQIATNRSGVDLIGSGQPRSGRIRSERLSLDLFGSDRARSDQLGSDRTRSDGSDLIKSDQIESDRIRCPPDIQTRPPESQNGGAVALRVRRLWVAGGQNWKAGNALSGSMPTQRNRRQVL